MKRRYFREIPQEKRLEAAATAIGWGYSREIPEAEECHWFSGGEDSLAWLQPGPPESEAPVLSLHACRAPDAETRGVADIERTKMALEVGAELLGAEYLAVMLDPGSTAIRKALVSRGWDENESGCWKQLGS